MYCSWRFRMVWNSRDRAENFDLENVTIQRPFELSRGKINNSNWRELKIIIPYVCNINFLRIDSFILPVYIKNAKIFIFKVSYFLLRSIFGHEFWSTALSKEFLTVKLALHFSSSVVDCSKNLRNPTINETWLLLTIRQERPLLPFPRHHHGTHCYWSYSVLSPCQKKYWQWGDIIMETNKFFKRYRNKSRENYNKI